MSGSPGSVRNGTDSFSIWRVPNFFFQPRGLYLGGLDEAIGGLNRLRSLLGLATLVVVAIVYQGFGRVVSAPYQPGQAKPEASNAVVNGRVYTFAAAEDRLGEIALSTILTAVAGIGVSVVVSLALVVAARRGARLATARQLLWPIGTVVVFVAYFWSFSVAFPWLDARLPGIVNFLILILPVIWFFKSIWLVVTGLFRADDGHPLLAPITSTITAWIFGVLAVRGAQPVGMPHPVWLVTVLGGPLSITVVAWIATRRLKRLYPESYPFRDGPLA
ncbi:hypothetical protein [Dactylosporangium sp. CA-152071]|uniref:hypothetical protein n=1 Tax=Dactylosporangium sp. CA-152071 TaxID=3239933 RepID=UPI003D8D0E58